MYRDWIHLYTILTVPPFDHSSSHSSVYALRIFSGGLSLPSQIDKV
jgi:hypothetical protein